ncbi:NAD(FAD)-utilizing dehydrogenases [hydrothermal vent metagenome]|uniref:NAD(FAD)-utilizing dehydrogenases n=1 Tax=hydrothermal vent metagenome TaxID=652676 RepID=A0A1W1C4W0_9ZZZZ
MYKRYDLIVVGSGGAGMMAAIRAARDGKRVLLLEKLSKLGSKLKATGGGRCNLTNRLDNESFMSSFGKNGRFMTTALNSLNHIDLIEFFSSIGVESHSPDGFRVFPTTHNSTTIIKALISEMSSRGVEIATSQKVESLNIVDGRVVGLYTTDRYIQSDNIIIATGGMGYPQLGAEGDGYELAKSAGHKITPLFPAMMPLKCKESWVSQCRADTIPKVKMMVDIKRYKKLQAIGDLIFTRDGIRGPVVLDFSREITPLLDKLGEVPLIINLTKGMNEEQIRAYLKSELAANPHREISTLLEGLLPRPLSLVLCELADIDPSSSYSRVSGINRDRLIKLLAWTPLTVVGSDGFDKAMITRGGISLKEIDPKTMQSKKTKSLYFCGEIIDLDGPCGGYNLQWAFSSGHLAGKLL